MNLSAAEVAETPPGPLTRTSTVPAPVPIGPGAGLVTMICVAVSLTMVADTAPNFTAVAPAKFVPAIVTVVPPVIAPAAGPSTITTGAAMQVNLSAAEVAEAPPRLLAWTSTVPAASSGLVATIWVAVSLTMAADTVPNFTAVGTGQIRARDRDRRAARRRSGRGTDARHRWRRRRGNTRDGVGTDDAVGVVAERDHDLAAGHGKGPQVLPGIAVGLGARRAQLLVHQDRGLGDGPVENRVRGVRGPVIVGRPRREDFIPAGGQARDRPVRHVRPVAATGMVAGTAQIAGQAAGRPARAVLDIAGGPELLSAGLTVWTTAAWDTAVLATIAGVLGGGGPAAAAWPNAGSVGLTADSRQRCSKAS